MRYTLTRAAEGINRACLRNLLQHTQKLHSICRRAADFNLGNSKIVTFHKQNRHYTHSRSSVPPRRHFFVDVPCRLHKSENNIVSPRWPPTPRFSFPPQALHGDQRWRPPIHAPCVLCTKSRNVQSPTMRFALLAIKVTNLQSHVALQSGMGAQRFSSRGCVGAYRSTAALPNKLSSVRQ